MASKPVPQDHKKKADAAKSVKATRTINDREVEGFEITHRGFTVFAPKEAFDDFELLDDLANLDQQKAHAFPSVLRRLIGSDYDVAMKGLRDATTGRVPVKAGIEYVNEIIVAVNPNG